MMPSMRNLTTTLLFLFISHKALTQDTTSGPVVRTDTVLRIINLNPFLTLHVDSALSNQLEINKNASA